MMKKKTKKSKQPAEIVKNLKEAILLLKSKEKNEKSITKAKEEISKNLELMKYILYGNAEQEPNQDIIAQLANEIYSNDILLLLIRNVEKFDFEAKKDCAQVFNNLLRRVVGNRSPTVEYILKNPKIIDTLIEGYENQEVALNCGQMLRECVRHESITKKILHSEMFYKFFSYVEMPNFDVASDAFATFKDLLTKHKQLCAEFLEKNYDRIFKEYTELLHSSNYVTKRQSLKLLGELLLDRANFNVMTRYISQQSNLKLMMNLLRDKSKSIQFEAFHVFKVFVANPNKPQTISSILVKNKSKLIKFLSNFHNDRDDEQFIDEKDFLLKQIEQMES